MWAVSLRTCPSCQVVLLGTVHACRQKYKMCYRQSRRMPRTLELRNGSWAHAPSYLPKVKWGGRCWIQIHLYPHYNHVLYPLFLPLPSLGPSHSYCKDRKIPQRLFLSLWKTSPRQLFCLYQYILYISGNFGKSWVSVNGKRVFFFFLKMFGPRDLWKGPFIYLQNGLHMRTIQKSLKTVIPWTLIKRFVCFQIAETNSGWFKQKRNFSEG